MEYNPVNPINPAPVQQPAVLTPEMEAHKDKAKRAMILGIVGAVLGCIPYGACIAGIICGAIAMKRAKRNKAEAAAWGIKENGMNVAAFWCGLGGLVFGIILTIITAVAIAVLVAAFSAAATYGSF